MLNVCLHVYDLAIIVGPKYERCQLCFRNHVYIMYLEDCTDAKPYCLHA